MSVQSQLSRLFGKGGKTKPLPRSTVTHDSVDEMVFGNFVDDSPRFKKAVIEDKPHVPPNVQEPETPDFATAQPDEIRAYQKEMREIKAAQENAPEYDAWKELTSDLFYSYHHPREPQIVPPGEVDPAVAFHAKIMQKITAEDDHAKSRNMTRDDGTMSAIATQASVRVLREALENELVEQARQSEEFEQARDSAENAMERLESMRNQAREQMQQGGQVDPNLVDKIRDAVAQKREAMQQAAQIADASPASFDAAAQAAVVAAAAAARDAAESAGSVPSFGQGFGQGEPKYESPEQALSIAEMWSEGQLKQIAELYGRIFSDFHFKRSKRVVGGQDEIVDIKLGDDLRRIVPSELVFLADDELFDDFLMRFLSNELLVFDTVGEEHAGRGPIVMVCDGSGSMSGDRNVFARATALALLNIARREKRDFAFVEFSSATQVKAHIFPTKTDLMAEDIVEMASHFFGGGTAPITGIQTGVEIMENAREFKKADLILVSDGNAGFGDEDRRLRDRLREKGVRIHGIGIGDRFGYLESMCEAETITTIHDLDLQDPNEATAQLAVQIT